MKRVSVLLVNLAIPCWCDVVVDQSYTAAGDLSAFINACCAFIAQTYTAGSTATLAGVEVDIAQAQGHGSFPLDISLRTVASGLPTSVVLGEIVLGRSSSSLPDLITFPEVINQVTGTQYAIVATYLGAPPTPGTDAQGIWFGGDGNPYPRGDLASSVDGISWFLSNPNDFDLHFQTFVNAIPEPTYHLTVGLILMALVATKVAKLPRVSR